MKLFSSSPPLFHLLLVLTICIIGCVNLVHTAPTKIGNGYSLIAIEESPDGGLIGHLKVKKKNNIYGPDISYLQLYVK